MTLSISDLISLVGIITSLLISLISVIISVINIKQNNKAIEASIRPYITVYATLVTLQATHLYIVLKNFGNTGAVIKSFSTSCDISKYDFYHLEGTKSIFDDINGTFFAPKQSIYIDIDVAKALKDNIHTINFKIEYISTIGEYDENVNINLDTYYMVGKGRASANKSSEYLKYISNCLEELVERKL